METVIIVSVLFTLGIVALVSAIVVMFIVLRKKVDVENVNREFEIIYRFIGENKEELLKLINENNESLWRKIEETERFIDSRCDKLDSKITTKKQVLTD